MNTKGLFWFLFLSILLTSCVEEPLPIRVTGITLNSTSLSLVEGETSDLVATVSPKDADNQTIIWSSTNGSIASVNNGRVTALKAGSTEITAKSDDGGFTAKCAVTVAPKVIEVISISLSKSEISLTEGESDTITASVKPDNAIDKTVLWSSSDASIANVKDGVITAIKEGIATITASAGSKTATCKVIVSKKYISVESITLNKTELSLIEGDSDTLVATIKPDDATDKSVAWSSSDSSVASVVDGTVIAISEGSAVITARSGNKTATCKVSVSKKVIAVESVELDQNELSLVVGDSYMLTATVKPENATDKTVTWTSSDSNVASVDGGKVIAFKEGTTVIIAQAGGKTAYCVVVVEQKVIPVEFVILNKTQIELFEGETEVLVASVKPDNATDKKVTWSTSDASIATVEDGRVTAIEEGVAIITASVGDKSAISAVIVKKAGMVGDVCSRMDDAAFKKYCYDNFDLNHDGKVSMDEADAVKLISVSGRNISSLNGIEYFSNLERLDCSLNSLAFLDVSKNDKLVSLNCSMNPSLRDIWYGDSISLLDLEFASEGVTSIVNKGNASIEGKWGLRRISCYSYYIDDSFNPEEDYEFEIDDYNPFKPSTDEDCYFTISKGYKSYVFSDAGYWDNVYKEWEYSSGEVVVDEASFPIDGLNTVFEIMAFEGGLKNETVFVLITPDYLSFELIRVEDNPWYEDNVDCIIDHSRYIFRRLN